MEEKDRRTEVKRSAHERNTKERHKKGMPQGYKRWEQNRKTEEERGTQERKARGQYRR